MRTNTYATLRGKTALVTGAGQGIGAALARALGDVGANVICVARTQSDIDDVARSIRDAGGTALALATDVTRVDQMDRLSKAIVQTFGGLNLAFLNAGGNAQRATIEDSDVDEWVYAFSLNTVSVFLGIRTVAPLMRKQGGGRIFVTGSAMAEHPAEKNSSYCAAKAAARMLAQTAALELGADGITVNEFVPGPTRTRQALSGVRADNASSPFNNPAEWIKDPDEVVDLMLTIAAYPGPGPNRQVFSLARR